MTYNQIEPTYSIAQGTVHNFLYIELWASQVVYIKSTFDAKR